MRGVLSTLRYPLKNSTLLDSATTDHITNNKRSLINYRKASEGDFVWAGNTQVTVLGYGDRAIKVQEYKRREETLLLKDVLYCKGMATNFVSVMMLKQQGIYWDMKNDTTYLRRRLDDSLVAYVSERYRQYVIEYIPQENDMLGMSFHSSKHRDWKSKKGSLADSLIWHLRLGHPGLEAIGHLVTCSKGVRIRGFTHECEACARAKMKRIIRRFPRDIIQAAGTQLSVDFHDFEPVEDFKTLRLVTDRYTGLTWDYYLPNHKDETMLKAFKHLFGMLEVQYSIKPKKLECDNEILNRPKTYDWLIEEKFVKVEPSPPHTQALNGGAERSGGVIKTKARSMRISSKLPEQLSQEFIRAAVYLPNRTPRFNYDWKSPYERFHKFIADGIRSHMRRSNLN